MYKPQQLILVILKDGYMFKQLVVLLIVLATAVTAFAQQTKEEIQKKQQQLQRELADLNSTLADIKKSKKQSLSQLALVQRKIKAREELVNSINKQLRNIDEEIYHNNLDIYRYKKELDTLKANYAKISCLPIATAATTITSTLSSRLIHLTMP